MTTPSSFESLAGHTALINALPAVVHTLVLHGTDTHTLVQELLGRFEHSNALELQPASALAQLVAAATLELTRRAAGATT